MGASLEVRQFLMRQEGADAGQGVSGGLPSQRTGGSDTQRVTDDQVRRARVAVASGASDREDCAMLLEMLGLTADEGGVPPVQR